MWLLSRDSPRPCKTSLGLNFKGRSQSMTGQTSFARPSLGPKHLIKKHNQLSWGPACCCTPGIETCWGSQRIRSSRSSLAAGAVQRQSGLCKTRSQKKIKRGKMQRSWGPRKLQPHTAWRILISVALLAGTGFLSSWP